MPAQPASRRQGTPWRYVCRRFDAFLAELQPIPAERTEAMACAAEVSSLVLRRFSARKGEPVRFSGEGMVVGGLGKETAIAPISGVSLLLVLPERLRPAAIRLGAASASLAAITDDMVAVMTARYGAVEMCRDGTLVVILSPSPHRRIAVRLRPGFLRPGGGYLIPAQNAGFGAAAGGGCGWGQISPHAEIAALDAADAATGNKARRLIRMLKAWRRSVKVPLSGIALELLACEFVTAWTYQRQSELFYDWMIRDFFFWLSAQAGRRMTLPGSYQTVSLGEDWADAARAAYIAAAQACDLERDNLTVGAISRWREIFGLSFARNERLPPRPVAVVALPAAE